MTTTTARTGRQRRHRPLLTLTAAMAVLALVTAAGLAVDDRTLLGANVWLKPFKFAVSFAVYGFTLAWILSVLPRRSRLAEWSSTVIVAVSVVEVAIITFQAARGHRSHYNDTTPFDSRLWSIMGASIMVLFVAHLVVAVVALRQRLPDRVAAYGIRLGLLLALLGFLAAIPMVMSTDTGIDGISGAHAVGVPDGGPGLPLTGWSTTGGDLRVGHFIGMHGLQALPLLAFLLTRTRLGTSQSTRLLLTAASAYAATVAIVTWQALRGQPLLAPDAATLAAAGAVVVATLIAGTLIVRSARVG
ncbi:hypothetical protein ACGFJ7_17195 [Actinoplanes sp. NPDC048988]|uniref:hypothetical protein n=1 Tax=Actinoplanes sp. NPDC048988 TaxID=3363901 RepID=UPI0037200859